MGLFEPVVIAREGGHYRLRQGADGLLSIPADIFEGFEADAVFPPSWSRNGQDRSSQEPRYMLWHPPTGEFLMSNIKPRPPLLSEVYGSHPFRSYLQVFWFPSEARLIARTYWNPGIPTDSFDQAARKISYEAQRRFQSIIMRLMPPPQTTLTLNAIDRYQRVIGLDGTGERGQPSLAARLWLAPQARLDATGVAKALESLSVEMAGRVYPTLDAKNLKWIETLTESDMREAMGILDENGVQYSETEFKSH